VHHRLKWGAHGHYEQRVALACAPVCLAVRVGCDWPRAADVARGVWGVRWCLSMLAPTWLTPVSVDVANSTLLHASISGEHCKFDASGDTVTVCDLGSATGTFLNGRDAPLVHLLTTRCLCPIRTAKVTMPTLRRITSSSTERLASFSQPKRLQQNASDKCDNGPASRHQAQR
jgi:hypothetical protein